MLELSDKEDYENDEESSFNSGKEEEIEENKDY
jgi:hypothetical protein